MLFQVSYNTCRKYKYAYKDASFAGFERVNCMACGRTVSTMHYEAKAHCLILEGGKSYPDYLQFCGAG